MNEKDLLKQFLNNEDKVEFSEIPTSTGNLDDCFTGLQVIRRAADNAHNEADFLAQLKLQGFTGMSKFIEDYSHIQDKMSPDFIQAYDKIAGKVNAQFLSGELSIESMKELGKEIDAIKKLCYNK